jgi:hypothetical protein
MPTVTSILVITSDMDMQMVAKRMLLLAHLMLFMWKLLDRLAAYKMKNVSQSLQLSSLSQK